eukprot:3235654-Rhodomonas_salina.4
MPSTDLARGGTSLSACYATPGTDLAYTGTSPLRLSSSIVGPAFHDQVSAYALPSTDVAYGAACSVRSAVCGTETAYGATRTGRSIACECTSAACMVQQTPVPCLASPAPCPLLTVSASRPGEMHNERAFLFRYVFPALRVRCLELRLHFRWHTAPYCPTLPLHLLRY